MLGRDAPERVTGTLLLVKASSLVHLVRRPRPLRPAYAPRVDQNQKPSAAYPALTIAVETLGYHDEPQGQRHSETRWQTRPAR